MRSDQDIAGAIRSAERKHSMLLLPAARLLAVLAAVAALLTAGDPWLRATFVSLLAVIVTWSAFLSRVRATSHPWWFAITIVAASQVGLLYFGLLSVAVVPVAFGLHILCCIVTLRVAICFVIAAAVGHALALTLVLLGVLADGVFSIATTSVAGGTIVVQLGFLLAFFCARRSCRELLETLATAMATCTQVPVETSRRVGLEVGLPGALTGHCVGDWEFLDVLGRGGMGEVYEARHTETDATAAIKILRREFANERMYIERFQREIRIARAVSSLHTVRILRISAEDDPLPYLVMERLYGRSLGELLRDRSVLAAERLTPCVWQIAGALDDLVLAGVVHRDVKPHNIFCHETEGNPDVWKLLDFGASHLDGAPDITQGVVVGTPAYMSPEQALGFDVDIRSDIYSLTAVIYRAVTGRPPYVGRDRMDLVRAVVHDMPVRPSFVNEVSPEVEAVLAIGLAKGRNLRFQTASELACAFASATAGELALPLQVRADAVLRAYPWADLPRDVRARPNLWPQPFRAEP